MFNYYMFKFARYQNSIDFWDNNTPNSFLKYNQFAMIMEIQKIDQVLVQETKPVVDLFDHYLHLCSKLFNDLISEDDEQCSSIFNCEQEPAIQIGSYIKRINKFTNFSSECLIIAIIYLDRYNIAKESFSFNKLNIHRIFLTCLLLATKFQDDIYYDNKCFELAGAVTTAQLMEYQLELTGELDYNLYVQAEQFEELVAKLQDAYANEE